MPVLTQEALIIIEANRATCCVVFLLVVVVTEPLSIKQTRHELIRLKCGVNSSRRPCYKEKKSNHGNSNYTSISEEFHYNCHSSMLKGYLQMLVIAELSTGRKVVGVARNGFSSHLDYAHVQDNHAELFEVTRKVRAPAVNVLSSLVLNVTAGPQFGLGPDFGVVDDSMRTVECKPGGGVVHSPVRLFVTV